MSGHDEGLATTAVGWTASGDEARAMQPLSVMVADHMQVDAMPPGQVPR